MKKDELRVRLMEEAGIREDYLTDEIERELYGDEEE